MALWTSAESYNLPYLVVAFLLVAELAVCLGLLFGFLTRLAALAVVSIMAVVLIFVHGGTTFEAVEFPLVLLAVGLALVITGGGYFSVDRAISVNLLPNVG
jgi:putative oxidoreductase